MEKKTEPSKKTQLIAGLFSLAVTLFIVYKCTSTDNNLTLSKPWNEMSYQEKQTWIEAYLKSPDDAGYQLIAMMNEGIKQKFTYPKEVEFDFGSAPTFQNAKVGDADSAWVFVAGSGTAKNVFGVKTGFRYLCRLTINPSTRRLNEINIDAD